MGPLDILARLKKAKLPISVVVASLVILVNASVIKNTSSFLGIALPSLVSSLVGALASIAYIVLAGYLFGKVFLADERQRYIKLVFGVLLLMFTFMLLGTVVVFFYRLNVFGLVALLYGPLVFLVVMEGLQKRGMSGGRKREARGPEKMDELRYFSPLYVVFLGLFAYCLFLLVSSRSGWVYGTVWDVVPASFFPLFTLLSLVLVGIILYSETKPFSKMMLTILYSTLSVMVFAIVLFPGSYGDPAVHLGWARMIVDYGTLKTGELSLFTAYWLIKAKGLALLTAVITNMFTVDVFWIHTFMPPVLWGISIPLITYKIAKIVRMREKVCVLAAFIAAFYSSFVQWGQRSTANSLGFIPLFLSLYFALWYLAAKKKRMRLLLAVFTAIVSSLTHPFTGVIALVFVLVAMGLKRYDVKRLQSPRKAYVLVLLVLLGGIFALPGVFALNNMVYLNFAPPSVRERYAQLEVISFDIEKLVKTDPWKLIFEGFAGATFKDAVLSGAILLLGIVGFGYALKKTAHARRRRVLVLFLFLVFVIHLIDFRILQYGMIHAPIGGGRMLPSRDLVVIPFSALAIYSLVGIFEGKSPKNRTISLFRSKRLVLRVSVRRIFVVLFVGLALSALATQSIDKSYAWLRGLHPTQLEVDAVKYIDEHTNGPYVVMSDPTTAMVGMCFVGIDNKEKRYVYAKAEYFREPSVTKLTSYMQTAGADVGYFIASTMRNPDFSKTVAEASRVFGLLTVLSNDEGGRLYIFKYRVPPLPRSPDVMAFYWESPEGYYVQNDLFRVIFSPLDYYLDVRDPRWDVVYESLDLTKTLVDGEPLGNFTSAEYYNPSSDMWVVWDQDTEIPFANVSDLARQFKFKLRFDDKSLVGVVERGVSSLKMRWEGSEESTLSVNVGDFTRLYIPGLISGVNSYDVNSRKFGLFYTASLTSGVVLHPSNKSEISGSSLTFSDIVKYCNYKASLPESSYTLYVENTADKDQWAYLEVWLPDAVYGGTFPPISYSTDDGETWTSPITGVLSEPIETFGGTDVNWVLTVPGTFSERPKEWIFSKGGDGGFFILPLNFTDSGGAQNRFFFSVYLPAHDKVLVSLGVPTYYVRPLKITYEFRDSDDASYGMRNMEENLIKFYNLGALEYVGGLMIASSPTSLTIVQDETGNINSVLVSILSETVFSFYAATGVDTTVDTDADGVPDNI